MEIIKKTLLKNNPKEDIIKIKDVNNYVNSTNQYSSPQIQTDNAQYIQSEFNANNYEQNTQNVQTNYIQSNPQEYTSNMNIHPVEYISSTSNENILGDIFTSSFISISPQGMKKNQSVLL
jgi:hypothetical protein